MLTKEGLEFLIRITDYFHGHWEDPGWGQSATSQALLLVSVHTLAGGIEDERVQREVRAVTERAIGSSVKQLVDG